MAFASIIMKARYDAKHLALSLKEGDEVSLSSYTTGYSIPGLSNRKLSQQRVGQFKVLAKIGHRAYYLQLPSVKRIHPVILVAQLDPAATTVAGGASDPYGRRIDPKPPPIHNESDDTEVDRILKQRITRGKLKQVKPYANRYGLVPWNGDLVMRCHDNRREQAVKRKRKLRVERKFEASWRCGKIPNSEPWYL